MGRTTRTLNVTKIPADLFTHLKGLAAPYGSWRAWLANIQDDFRKCRDMIAFQKEKIEFLERRLKDADETIQKLLQEREERG